MGRFETGLPVWPFLAAGALVLPVPAGGQLAESSDRWLPWIGCWEGTAALAEAGEEEVLVCFEPLSDGSGVGIRSFAGGELVAEEAMRADGVARPVAEEGCAGEQRAEWSADGRRVFVISELTCGAGLVRTARGTLSLLPEGRGWVEVHAVRAGRDAPFVGLRTFVPATAGRIAAEGATDPSAGLGLAVATARAGAGGRPDTDAIVELVDRAGPEVTGALLAERGESHPVDARYLRSLAERGVPGEVLDVLVAVTWPERFTVTGGIEVEEVAPPAVVAARRPTAPWPPAPRSYRGYSPWSWGLGVYDGWAFSRGLGTWGSWYDPFGSPWLAYPRVIVIDGPVAEDRRSVLSRTRGVVPPANPPVQGSGSAVPSRRSAPPPVAPPPSSGSGASAPPPRGGSGGAAPRDGGSGGSGADPVPERRAVPRSGGG